jgi:predicted O-linked N-acetylglucosamine transferase (SPINDLY family)
LKRFADAVRAFDEVLRLNPAQGYILGARRHAQMQICDWSGLARDLDLIVEGLKCRKAVCPPHALLALIDSAPLHRLAAEVWMERECPPDDSMGAIPAHPVPHKIRIGYFSADFRHHAVAMLTAELFEIHDRAKFEIVAFAFGPESKDDLTVRLQRAFDVFLDVRAHSDIEIAALARRLEIDIAVDLGGFTEHCRTGIFALRAAPIQLSYIGYLGTMGAPYMDYLLADSAIIPDTEQSNYCEKIVYLPSYQVNDSSMRVSARVFTRGDLGLPARGFVYSSFNTNYKIMPDTFAIWMRILNRVENSCIFIYSDSEIVDCNLRNEARKLGVDSNRIIFGRRMAREDYLARFRAMDLFLDTFPYNAGTTASDALWVGLPVLTYTGRSFAARVATSLLTAIDLPELITSSAQQYEELAVQLAQQPERLAEIRAKLQRNRLSTPLFDTRSFAANLESAYTTMMQRHESGLAPDHIRVNS